MADYNRTLHLLARKLGFGDDTKILRKAAEYDRLLQTKSTAGNAMSVTTKLVICLDLAAFTFGSGFDLKNAIKYSGLKPSAYTNCRKTIQNLLELRSESLTIAELCVSLQCSEVQNLAEKILREYQTQSLKVAITNMGKDKIGRACACYVKDGMFNSNNFTCYQDPIKEIYAPRSEFTKKPLIVEEIDTKLPQYVCMAVYQACRLSKIKMSKSKLLEKSNLKQSQWSKLEAQFTKFIEESFSNSMKSKKEKVVCEDFIEEKVKDMSMEDIEENQKCADLEPYEDWKKRMLESAYRDLEVSKKCKKSLSKTTSKFSPYKREPQCEDVKLIFVLK